MGKKEKQWDENILEFWTQAHAAVMVREMVNAEGPAGQTVINQLPLNTSPHLTIQTHTYEHAWLRNTQILHRKVRE